MKQTNHSLVFMSLVAVAVMLVSSCTSGPQQKQVAGQFTAHLSAAKGVMSQATGDAHFQLSPDGMKLSYQLRVSNVVDLTMAHIHVSAAPGENGDVAAWLYPSVAPMKMKEGNFSGVLEEGTMTAANLAGPLKNMSLSDLVDRIKQGRAYVNVHTKQNPDGEITGAIQ
jgi:CHRD domain